MANNYNLAFDKIDEIKTPVVDSNSDHVYHQYTLRVLNGKRDELKKYLNDLGIPSVIYYPIPIQKQKPHNLALNKTTGAPTNHFLEYLKFCLYWRTRLFQIN